MTEQECQLILAWVSHKMSEAEFLERYPVNPRESPDHIVDVLQEASRTESADDVECAMLLGFRFGVPSSAVPVLNELLVQSWHTQHENIAMALQRLKHPSSVESLFVAAQSRHPYLDYDEAHALAVKCIWALGDVGTPEARGKLELLAKSEIPVVRAAAEKQLARLA